MTESVTVIQESDSIEQVREVLDDVQKEMLLVQSGNLPPEAALDKVEDIRQSLDDCKLTLQGQHDQDLLIGSVRDLEKDLSEIRVKMRPQISLQLTEDNGLVEVPATPQVENAEVGFLKPKKSSVTEMSDASDMSDNEEVERKYSITSPMEEQTIEELRSKFGKPPVDPKRRDSQETPAEHGAVRLQETEVFEPNYDYSIESFKVDQGKSIDLDDALEDEDNDPVISSTPEAEKYFQAHVRTQMTRFSRGDLDV
eukprot:maker-scaffold189_size271641-snap-gene-1.19 protein:Tk03798 transcript:maker-scaffold189_size271641-snap-gene-1.19-mRNA-1 annotation:"dna-binding domain-containing -type"